MLQSHHKSARRGTMKRSRQEIFSQILDICLTGANKTKIVYQANLNFRTVNPYLEILIKNQHLIEIGQGAQILYKTTPKGTYLLESINEINSTLFQKWKDRFNLCSSLVPRWQVGYGLLIWCILVVSEKWIATHSSRFVLLFTICVKNFKYLLILMGY